MIYRGFVIEPCATKPGFYVYRPTKAATHAAEHCASEDDAMAYVDAVKRREFQKGVEAARKAGA